MRCRNDLTTPFWLTLLGGNASYRPKFSIKSSFQYYLALPLSPIATFPLSPFSRQAGGLEKIHELCTTANQSSMTAGSSFTFIFRSHMVMQLVGAALRALQRL